jgi:hypothetical protein
MASKSELRRLSLDGAKKCVIFLRKTGGIFLRKRSRCFGAKQPENCRFERESDFFLRKTGGM